MRRRDLLAASSLAVVAAAGGRPAFAEKATDTLRVGESSNVTNVDPYYNSLRSGLIVAHQAWDGLVYREPSDFSIKPLLATSWKLVDDLTYEFELRKGVTFHNGDPFTADDVVYTLNLVSKPEAKTATPSNQAWIDRAEKVDDHKVIVRLKQPTPAALQFFAFVTPIYPKAYRERVGPDGYARQPVGAGPYKIVRFEPGKELLMERYEGYYADSPKKKPAIGKVLIRYMPDAATMTTEFLAQRLDFMWNFSPDQFAGVSRLPFATAVRQESMRVGYLSIDAAGRTGAGNPLTKLEVRQAIFHAIDRKAIAERLVQGGSRVPPAPCFPTQFGCDGSAAVEYDYNPAKAKELLAKAGYANGFDVEILTYVLPAYSAAVQSYLGAVGIRAKISQLQTQAVIDRVWRGESQLNMGSWGSYSINDVAAIMPVYFGGTPDDYSRDPEVQKLIADAGRTNDEAKRKEFYSAAIKKITENAYWMPLHTYVSTYAMSKQLKMNTYPDEMHRYYEATWV